MSGVREQTAESAPSAQRHQDLKDTHEPYNGQYSQIRQLVKNPRRKSDGVMECIIQAGYTQINIRNRGNQTHDKD